MNTHELEETFMREKADRQTRLAERLAAGEEIDLLEALLFCGITNLRKLWVLEQFDACGRIGGPLEPMQPIAKTAWPRLRLIMVESDPVLETPEGKRTYDVRLSMSKDRPAMEFRALEGSATNELLEPSSSSARAEVAHTQHAQRLVDLDEFFSAMVADSRNWSLADYSAYLAQAGLMITPGGKRVNAALSGGAVQRSDECKTALSTILLAAYCEQTFPVGSPRVTNRTRIWRALDWLKAHHPYLVEGNIHYTKMSDGFLDATHRKLLDDGFPNRSGNT